MWDIADQWYQKWNVVFSVEHMWNWKEHGVTRQQLTTTATFDTANIQPWLNHIKSKYNVHPDHQALLQAVCHYISQWHQSNRSLTLNGSFKINTLPFFPPSWFTNKSRQNITTAQGLSPSYLANFVPPYKPSNPSYVPERWDQVFLKGLTVDPNHKFNLDPILIASAIPIFGLTIDLDQPSGFSRLMVVMPKAKYGNLEDKLEKEIPTNYWKPLNIALSITKDIKDLHWNYIHGNIHPRNILLNNAEYLGELVDITFMQRNNNERQHQHHLCGRWPYVAPEVVQTGLSTAADMYALGIILWQLVSRVTFPGDALVDPDVYRIEPIPHVLPEYETIYTDCLNRDPAKRPNAYTIYKRLSTLCATITSTSSPVAEETLEYIRMRKREIHKFLSNSRRLSTPSASSLSTTSSLDEEETICQVGNHVLTTSVTRPSHQRLQSYPNLIQKFP